MNKMQYLLNTTRQKMHYTHSKLPPVALGVSEVQSTREGGGGNRKKNAKKMLATKGLMPIMQEMQCLLHCNPKC